MTALPHHLILEVTRHCNHRCRFCYCVWHEFPEFARRDLGTAAWKRIVTEAVAQGVDSFLFTGGEAMLRKDIRTLLDHARALLPRGEIALFTNGSRLTEEWLKYLKRRRIRVSTSLPGLRTYAELTGTRRSFRPLLRKIALAAEMGWPLDVSIAVNRINLAEAEELFVAAALSRAKSIQMGAVMAEGRVRNDLELMLTPAEWAEVKRRIRALPDCRVPYSFSDEFYCRCREYPVAWVERFGADRSPCPAGKTFGVIGPGGKFRKCLHTVEETPWRHRLAAP